MEWFYFTIVIALLLLDEPMCAFIYLFMIYGNFIPAGDTNIGWSIFFYIIIIGVRKILHIGGKTK